MSAAKPQEIQVERQIVMPASVAGSNIPEEDLDRIRYGEDMKAYVVGRYIDPSDSSIMYEKNVLYRVEESPQWNLRPNTEIRPPVGKTPREPPTLQKIVESELRSELERQRRFSESLILQTGKAAEAVEKAVAGMKRIEEQNSMLVRRISELERQMGEIDAKIREIEAERTIENLKKEAGK